jgi:hypothetical protein
MAISISALLCGADFETLSLILMIGERAELLAVMGHSENGRHALLFLV